MEIKFQRQHAIGPFIVDFFCEELNLIVEIDGPIHAIQVKKDEERESFLLGRGYNVVRFSNAYMQSCTFSSLRTLETFIDEIKQKQQT